MSDMSEAPSTGTGGQKNAGTLSNQGTSVCINCGRDTSRRHKVNGAYSCDHVTNTNTAVPALLPAPGVQTHRFVRRASGLIAVAESDADLMSWCAGIRDDADRLAELLRTEQAARLAVTAHQVSASLFVQSAVSRGTADVLRFADERMGAGVFLHEIATLMVANGFIGGGDR